LIFLGAKRELFKITYGTSQTTFYTGPDLAYQLREGAAHYKALYGVKNNDMALENTYFWDANV